jgi:hypothetical protein
MRRWLLWMRYLQLASVLWYLLKKILALNTSRLIELWAIAQDFLMSSSMLSPILISS